MAYAVSTPVFEGPFDLLLHLISNQQVDVHEISLTGIVEGFVGQLEHLGDLDLDQSSEFLLIAAILIELKARRLLPQPEGLDLDDEFALWEERDLLLARLLECKTFKDAAGALGGLAATAALSWPRRVGPDERFAGLVPDLLAGVDPMRLKRAFERATTPKPAPLVDLSHVTPIRFSVADAVLELCHELPRVGRITFRRLTADLVERVDVVVHFLAILELYKQGLIELEQATTFGDLAITWAGQAPAAAAELAMAGADVYEG
jgi:segregation and condensation protein A